MSIEIRPITPEEQAPFSRRLGTAFGGGVSDERTEAQRKVCEHDRSLSAWDGGELVATAGAFTFEVTVPGGGSLAAAGVTMVSVSPTHRRRGILRSFMERQLDDVADRGEPLALLTASEGSIYGRFGYGPATWWSKVTLPLEGTELSRPSTAGGRMRNLAPEDRLKVVPSLFERTRHRYVGELKTSEALWAHWAADHSWERGSLTPLQVAVHESDDGEPDGYVSWRIKGAWSDHGLPASQLHIDDLFAVDDEVETALWQHLMSVDLVRTVTGARPVDDQLRWRLVEPRKLQVEHVGDHLWVRIVDVAGALGGRAYDVDDSLVLGLVDPFRPANDGTWRVGPDGCGRTDAAADVELDVADLGSLYLGGVTASQLARAGRVRERTAGALRRADLLLASPTAPWCATGF